MLLRFISVPALIAEVGGDPWAINTTLLVGRPAQIADLAEAFHAAGRCIAEANDAFEQARRRFDAGWNHQNGDHPINDAAEVQRVTASLGAQSLQLPKIGVDLENIAAALAEAQTAAGGQISSLESQLQALDDVLGQALELEKDPNLAPATRDELNVLITACEDDAVVDAKAAVGSLQSIRDGYAQWLQKSLTGLRSDGYDPAAIRGLDADAAPEPSQLQTKELADIRQATNQAVVDQMAKVRAAQQALDKTLADLYTHGPGSTEGEAASANLPKLKADLAKALDDLDPRYRITDSTTAGETIKASLTITGPVLTWLLVNDRGQMQISLAPTHSVTAPDSFWVSLIRQYVDVDPDTPLSDGTRRNRMGAPECRPSRAAIRRCRYHATQPREAQRIEAGQCGQVLVSVAKGARLI